MKDVFLVYDGSCFYEIIILNYFMSFTKCDVLLCSMDGKPVRTMEGYSVNTDLALEELDREQIRSLIIPGGRVDNIRNREVAELLHELKDRGVLIAAICAAVDVLDETGILEGIRSTHSEDSDLSHDGGVITARANAYVDFAIETAKTLGLFADEKDLQETVDFWKNYKRMQ